MGKELGSGAGVAIDASHVVIRKGGFLTELGRMSAKIVVGGVLILLLVALIGAMFTVDDELMTTRATIEGDEASQNEILALRISGPILNHPPRSSSSSFFGLPQAAVTYGYGLKDQLEEAAENEAIKAVFLHVSTPGGQIAGSQAIHDGIQTVRSAGKPVVVYVDGISASGGVWATAGATAIFADHGSFVGSVGVRGPSLMEYVDPVAVGGIFDAVETRGGVRVHVTTAGAGKDLGNPFRAPTEAEKASLQALVDESYEDFLSHVAAHRGIDAQVLRTEYGASIFANGSAEAIGYIDGTKTYEETIAFTATEAGLGEDFKLTVNQQAYASPLFFGITSALNPAALETRLEAAGTAVIAGACEELKAQVVAMSTLSLAQTCGR